MSEWEQDGALSSQVTSERVAYWRRRAVYPYIPSNWADVWAGWLAQGVFMLHAAAHAMPDAVDLSRATGRAPAHDLGPWAVMASFHRRDWIFSHQAVYYAALAWQAWNIQAVIGGGWAMRWLNHVPHFSGDAVYVSQPTPVPGFLAAAGPEHILLWHPLILGPVGRWAGDRILPSPGIAVDQTSEGLWRFRGEAVTGGVWQNKRLHPVPALNGWFSEQSIWYIEEMNS